MCWYHATNQEELVLDAHKDNNVLECILYR